METIRRGSRGEWVKTWQLFLRGQNMLMDEADGIFGPATHDATVRYQRLAGLGSDGVVGNATWGQAMVQGLNIVEDTDQGRNGPNWPPKPEGLSPANHALRTKLFGTFQHVPAPTAGNPEGITILGTWVRDNIVSVGDPQLVGVDGANSKGTVLFNKKAAPQLLALFEAWDKAGLMPLVRTWAGAWVPRYVRGSRTSLSNHSMGSAFDINAAWNGLGRQPALVGQIGSVRELVPLAVEHGFFWGGWGFGPANPSPANPSPANPWSTTAQRPDGMHFEVAELKP